MNEYYTTTKHGGRLFMNPCCVNPCCVNACCVNPFAWIRSLHNTVTHVHNIIQVSTAVIKRTEIRYMPLNLDIIQLQTDAL